MGWWGLLREGVRGHLSHGTVLIKGPVWQVCCGIIVLSTHPITSPVCGLIHHPDTALQEAIGRERENY